jgi:regulator of sigma E protease
MAINYKPVWVRILVLLAGPLSNLLFATVLYWIIFLFGTTSYVPILGHIDPHSAAGLAGLKAGQEIVAIEGKATSSWEAVSLQLLAEVGEEKNVTVSVLDPNTHKTHEKMLDISGLFEGASNPNWMEGLGFIAWDPVPAVINKVLPDYPASKAGLRVGDKIIMADKEAIGSRSEIIHYVHDRPNQAIALTILREGKKIELKLTPAEKESEEENKKIGFIGIEFPALTEIPPELIRTQRYGVIESFGKAVHRTVDYSVLTLEVLKKMVVGKVSVREVSGPISIAQFAGESAINGIKQFLGFLALVSISLGVLNLLPIPILDGGYVFFCLCELIIGRPLPAVAFKGGMLLGGIVLVGFTVLAFYNDITRLFF